MCSRPALSSAPWARSTFPGCQRSRAWRPSPGPRSTPHAGREDLDIRGTRFALIGAGASGFQIGPAIATEVDHLTIFQRTAQWILPNRLYHTPVPPGDAWALRHLPFYGRWYRFVMTFAGIAAGTDMFRIDPQHDDPTHQSVNALNARRAMALLESMRSLVGDDPELLEKVIPGLPRDG